MTLLLEIGVGMCILAFAWLDLRNHEIPSFMTTTVILALLLIQPENLIWGISAFTFGWLLYEFDFLGGKFFGGTADIKVVTIIGLMITSLQQFANMMLTTGGFSVILAIVLYYYNGKKIPKEIPFIPVLVFVYGITIAVGYLI